MFTLQQTCDYKTATVSFQDNSAELDDEPRHAFAATSQSQALHNILIWRTTTGSYFLAGLTDKFC